MPYCLPYAPVSEARSRTVSGQNAAFKVPNMESTPFFVFLFFHLASLILGVGAVLVSDYYGFRWMQGIIPLSRTVRVVGITEKLIWAGWTGLVITGVPLIILKGEIDELMIIKFFFVLLVAANGIALHYLRENLKMIQDYEAVPTIVKFRMGLVSFISQLGWWGALLIGFLHRHVESIIEWPPNPYLVSLGILLVLLGVWVMGEKFIGKRK
jgi:hypothetical protein